MIRRGLLACTILAVVLFVSMGQEHATGQFGDAPGADDAVLVSVEFQVKTKQDLSALRRQIAALARYEGFAVNVTVAGKSGHYADLKSAQQALNAIDAVMSKGGAQADVALPDAVQANQPGGLGQGVGQSGVPTPEQLQQIQVEMRQVEARVSKRISSGEAGIPPSREGMAKIFREELDRSKEAGKLPYDFNPGFGSGSGGGGNR